MAYPIKLFDFQTNEGRTEGNAFIQHLDKSFLELFIETKTDEKLNKYHKFAKDEVPSYLIKIGEKCIMEIMKKLPDGDMKWQGSLGAHGRKVGTVIKKGNGILYRMIINMGDTEIYHLDGGGLKNEPVILPNGYALLCSPIMIDKVDIKVNVLFC